MKVPTTGPAGAKIFLIGEAPGKDEDTVGLPFVGYAGKTLNWLLSQAGIARAECLIGNVAKVRPDNNKIGNYFLDKQCTIPNPQMQEWITELKNELLFHKPNVVVALGATALWALTGLKAISKHRGYITESTLVPGLKVIPTYHPQNINYEWKNFFPTVIDLRKVKKHSVSPKFPLDKRVLMHDVSKNTFIEYCKDILNDPEKDRVCIDIESSVGGHPHVKIFGMAHSANFGMSIYILKGKYACYPEREEIELWKWIARICEEKDIIIQNSTYDTGVLYLNHGILVKKVIMDTLVGAHVVWPELPRDLGFLGSLCLDVPEWKTKSNENPSLYNVNDCVNTFGVSEVLEKEIDKGNLRDTFNFEMSQCPVALTLQLQGIEVDEEERNKLLDECNKVIQETGTALRNIVGKDVNYGSHQQLKKLLYVDLKLPPQFQRRKHASDPRVLTVDANALKRLSRIVPDNPILNLILEHKRYRTLKKFVDVEVSPNGKVHSSYNITGSSTEDEGRKSFGRWSSSGSIILPYGSGNLQNIPPKARTMYCRKQDHIIIQGDLVQAEAVVVTWLINDQRMKEAFNKSFGLRGELRKPYDVHRITAAGMYGIDIMDVTDEQRKVGKTIRHATNYSAGPVVVQNKLGCTLSEARKYLDMYHQSCPKLKLWHRQIEETISKSRVLTNCLGRVHRFLDRPGDSLLRSALSFIPQSSVGDLLNMALVELYTKHGDWMEILLQLHDAIYVRVINQPEVIIKTVKSMRECMVKTLTVNRDEMTIDVDFKIGPSWGDQEDLDDIKLLKEAGYEPISMGSRALSS